MPMNNLVAQVLERALTRDAIDRVHTILEQNNLLPENMGLGGLREVASQLLTDYRASKGVEGTVSVTKESPSLLLGSEEDSKVYRENLEQRRTIRPDDPIYGRR